MSELELKGKIRDINYLHHTYSKVELCFTKTAEPVDETDLSPQHWQRELITISEK